MKVATLKLNPEIFWESTSIPVFVKRVESLVTPLLISHDYELVIDVDGSLDEINELWRWDFEQCGDDDLKDMLNDVIGAIMDDNRELFCI